MFKPGIVIFSLSIILILLSSSANAEGPLREYRGWITASDLRTGTITISHRATRYTATLRTDANTIYQRHRQAPFADLPSGALMRFWGGISPDLTSINLAGVRLAASDATLKPEIIPAQNYIGGRLIKEADDQAFIEVDDKRVAVKINPYEFEAFYEETGELADVVPGRECDVSYEAEGENGGLLKRVLVTVTLPKAPRPPSDPAGVPSEQIRADFEKAKALCVEKQAELAKLAPVTMTATPELAKLGEPVTLRMEVLSAKEPNPEVELYPNYFVAGMDTPRPLRLEWKQTGERHGMKVYTADAKLPAGETGGYLVHWVCDAGGDIPDYWRYYSVINDASAVCIFMSTSHSGPQNSPAPDFHKARVPFGEWLGAPLVLNDVLQGNVETWASWSREARQYGTEENPHIFGPYWVTGVAKEPQANFQAEPPEVQRAILAGYHELLPLLGFGQVNIMTAYTMGKEFVEIARDLGYNCISAVCSEQNFMDGPMRINHFGMPERPYFIDKEDFRKAGGGGPDGLVGMPQCQRNPFMNREFNCTYCLEPAWNDFFNGGGGRETLDDIWMSRMYDFFDAMLENRLSQTAPYFFNVGIEFNGTYPGSLEGNRMLIDYAAEKAATEPLVFSTGPAVTEYYRRHFAETPESTCYQQDYFGGQTALDKYPGYPDIMEIEGPEFKSLLRAPDILPVYHYDYTIPWNCPDWGNDDIPRNRWGYLYPGMHDPYAVVPKILDTRRFTVSRTDQDTGGAYIMTFAIEAEMAQKNVALAVWDAPREWRPGQGWWRVEGKARFVPIRAPFTGNLNGILVVDVEQGANTITLTIDTPAAFIQKSTIHIGAAIEGRVFKRDGVTMAYLWPTRPWGETLVLNLPADETATAYIAPKGEAQPCVTGENTFVIPAGKWMRVVGLSAEALEACCSVGG